MQPNSHLLDAVLTPVDRFLPAEPSIGRPALPPGHHIELPGRGTTFVRGVKGPAGAPTVVLLHGWMVTAAVNWLTVYRPLAEHFNVVSLDHRGHGRGIRSRRAFRLQDCADDAVALADVLGIDQFVAAGYSMGGPIAQLTWHRHRDRVTGLVLGATFARSPGASGQRRMMRSLGVAAAGVRLLPRHRQLEMFRSAAAQVSNSDAGAFPPWLASEIRSSDVPTVLQAGSAIAGFDSREWIGGVDVGVSVIITERDAVVPPLVQHQLVAKLPAQTFVTSLSMDHDGVIRSPKLFADAFVNSVRRAALIPSSRR